MENEPRDAAARNFDRATSAVGEAQIQTIAPGLIQPARAMRHDCKDTLLMDVAARNFESVRAWQGDAQLDRMALGPAQFARAL